MGCGKAEGPPAERQALVAVPPPVCTRNLGFFSKDSEIPRMVQQAEGVYFLFNLMRAVLSIAVNSFTL